MKNQTNNYYLTTPIYYATARPHLGSLYSTIIADVLARWNRLQGKQVFFMTGTDEHGQKIADAAKQVEKTPQAFVDEFIPLYKQVWDTYGISYTHFARTTDNSHVVGAQQLIKTLQERGDIYASVYAGWYCTPCETFVNQESETAPLCSTCNRETTMVQEETYFFKLSAYQDKLLSFYNEHPEFITPSERFNEVIRFVESGLKDFSISRTTVSWGVPFPTDEKHTIYVWAEALCSYLTSVGYGDASKSDEFEKWWPPAMQVLGKDIIRFHAVYWPAFLMSAGLQVPKRLLVHGWIRVGQEKMSKSKGNAVDPIPLAKNYGADEIRYFLMRYLAVNQDGEFCYQHLHEALTADLANDLGNLLNRVLLLAQKYEIRTLDPVDCWDETILELRNESKRIITDFKSHMDNCSFHLALARLWQFIKKINGFFHEQEPWKLVKHDQNKFISVIAATCHSLKMIAILAASIMPEKMKSLLAQLGATTSQDDAIEELLQDAWYETFTLSWAEQGVVLFKKWEPYVNTELEVQKTEPVVENYIGIEDFVRVELVTGTIISAEPVSGSDKLLCLQVDFGDKGKRQILSGIAKHFKSEDLVSKQTVFVLNLKPRKMMGMESRGMLLTATKTDGTLSLLSTQEAVLNGIQLK